MTARNASEAVDAATRVLDDRRSAVPPLPLGRDHRRRRRPRARHGAGRHLLFLSLRDRRRRAAAGCLAPSPAEIEIMLQQIEHVPTLPTIRLGLRLILLAMVRKSELQDAVRDEVDVATPSGRSRRSA